MSERDRAAALLQSFVPGQALIVGRHHFVVERTYGVTVYVTKGKGRKLYRLDVTSLEPLAIAVREVWPGSGDLKDVPPVVQFQP